MPEQSTVQPAAAGYDTGTAGLANERMGNLAAAMEYHEKHRELLRLSGACAASSRPERTMVIRKTGRRPPAAGAA